MKPRMEAAVDLAMFLVGTACANLVKWSVITKTYCMPPFGNMELEEVETEVLVVLSFGYLQVVLFGAVS